jgi:hypothetical protein
MAPSPIGVDIAAIVSNSIYFTYYLKRSIFIHNQTIIA